MSGRSAEETVRALLADVLDDPAAAALPADTPLFGGGLELTSLSGVALLTAIHTELGVDVAAEDLELACLSTIGTLCAFVAARAEGGDRLVASPPPAPDE